jgi:CRP-like cAMP-binding protein
MNTRLLRFKKGDVIFRAGETTRNMYIIRTGTARVLIEKEGKQIPITDLGQGQYVGEMSFLTGVKRSATVIAATDIIVNEIPPEILEDEHLGLSTWAVSIAKVLVRRIRTTTEQLGDYLAGHEGDDMPIARQEELEGSGGRSSSTINKTRRLYLKGRFSESSIEAVKKKIREIKIKQGWTLILDFSEVIDIDQGGINFIYNLIRSTDLAAKRIQIENMQLIRDKVLSIKGLQSILAETRVPIRHVEKDELLIRQGDVEHVMYFVKNGSFTISRETENGTITLAQAENGDVIGEMSLIMEGKRSADVRADRPGTVHVLDVKDFYNNVYNVPKWFLELIRGLVLRLRNTNEMIVKYESSHHDQAPLDEWNQPLNITLDSTKPGKFAVRGALTLANFHYLNHLLKLEMMNNRKEIILDLSGVTKVDGSCRPALDQIIAEMKTGGTGINLIQPS